MTDRPENPMLLSALGLTLGMGLLLGLALREYYLVRRPHLALGSTRTLLLAALLGFVMQVLDAENRVFIGGLVILGLWLGIFYRQRLLLRESGMLGMFFVLFCFCLGPLSLKAPSWLVVASGIAAIFVLNARTQFRQLLEHLSSEEVITVAKFLVLSSVILPLTPREPMAVWLPVSFHETWLAVVVISGISYLSYLLQRYFMKEGGLVLIGAIGGIYSSTATSVVLARRSRQGSSQSPQFAAGIILATGMMYLRLMLLVLFFDRTLGVLLAPYYLGLCVIALGVSFWLQYGNSAEGETASGIIVSRNPLELGAAAVFAGSFLLVTALTHVLLRFYPLHGLEGMAFLTGFTDIDPFVMTVVSGHLEKGSLELASAITLAAGSNGLMKALYVILLGSLRTRWIAGSFLALVGLVSVVLAFSVFQR